MKSCLTLSVFFVALAFALAGVAVVIRESDPATARARAAEVQYRIERDRQDLAQRQRQADQWADFTAAVMPAAKIATGLLVICSPFALAALSLAAWSLAHRRAALVYPNARGLLPADYARLRAGEYDQTAALALTGYHLAQVEAARNPNPVLPSDLRTYSPRYATPRVIGSPDRPAPVLPSTPAPSPALPGPVDLARVLSAPPSLDRVLLAVGPGGAPITTGARDMGHVAFAGATGGGKSNLLRLLLAQLLAAGARAILTDPHYTPLDVDTGEDWRPIAAHLLYPPAVGPAEIADVLGWLITELESRLARRRAGEPIGPPLYWAADELPAIVAAVPGADATLGRIVREGRKVRVYAVTSAQDWLTRTVGGSQAMKENFLTAFYTGGDASSARLLLDLRGTIDDAGLGRGLAWLRCKATPAAQLVRVPLASNDAIAGLLPAPATSPRPFTVLRGGGATTDEKAPDGAEIAPEDATTAPTTTADAPGDAETDRRRRVRELAERGMSRSRIALELWGYKDTRVMREIAETLGDTTHRGLRRP